MARVLKPYWVSYSVPNWAVCNLFLAGVAELALAAKDVAWASGFPMTKTLAAGLVVLFALYWRGRVAVVGMDAVGNWRPAKLPEPGEPPADDRLAWPSPKAAHPRVATRAARALTRRRAHTPTDRGESPNELTVVPTLGFLLAVLLSFFVSFLGPSGALGVIWLVWGAVVWVSITTAIVLSTRRLNEDA